MLSRLMASVFVISLAAAGAQARDRPVTDDERVKLVAALTALGCAGGKMEFDDDGYFEVDDSRCAENRKYDLKFDTSFKLIKKELDD